MCRWLAHSGSPVLIARALYAPAHSLIDQSLHSKLGAEATNGDGFGICNDEMPAPGIFRSFEQAWNDQNLRELAGHITSGRFFAHIHAAIGFAVQQTNCHPFRHGRWLFMHNGFIANLATVKCDLALTCGPEDDPLEAVARAVGLVEAVGQRRGVQVPVPGHDRHDRGDLPGAWNEVPE
jgi:predicted glutamine amidotransferase